MMRAVLLRAALVGSFFAPAVASARVPPAASPPIWSHPNFSVHWGSTEFVVDEHGELVYAIADLLDSAGNLVGSVKDTYHADFEDWEYNFFWPGTTEVAGWFRIPSATSDPHASSNRGNPGRADQLYRFTGDITEATGVFGEEGPMPLVGAQVEMRAEVGLDGSFGCTCTVRRWIRPAGLRRSALGTG